MVGRLSLQDVPELVDAKKKGDGVLDSPDSGLPPSPSPSHWALAAAGGGGGGERAPAPGALEPDAAATPAAPVSDPASAPPPILCIPPRLGPGDPQAVVSALPVHAVPAAARPSASAGSPPVASAGSPGREARREPGQLEPVAGKLSSPGRPGSPGKGDHRLLPSG